MEQCAAPFVEHPEHDLLPAKNRQKSSQSAALKRKEQCVAPFIEHPVNNLPPTKVQQKCNV